MLYNFIDDNDDIMLMTCGLCGCLFSRGYGNPCHNYDAHKGESAIFCPACAGNTEYGWRCNPCYQHLRNAFSGRME
jgi:hypothetical protein